MDGVSITAVCISGALIFTTIQAQDFADVEGDRMLGRRTFPIYAPELSRQVTLLAVIGWSIFLGWFWKIGLLFRVVYVVLGGFVGLRYYLIREAHADRITYMLYNASSKSYPDDLVSSFRTQIWLTVGHILPLHARTGILDF